MTDQVTQGDLNAAASPDSAISKLSMDWADQMQSSPKSSLAPDNAVAKVALVTGEAVYKSVPGLGHAFVDDVEHLGRTAEMFGVSAGVGAILKTALPETGAAGKIAGGLIAGYFLYQAAKPAGDAYSKAVHAKTWDDLNKAGDDLGDAVGGFALNTVVAGAGYRVGAGFTGRALMSEKLDGFAALKEKVWHPFSSDGARPNVDVVEPTKSAGLASRVRMDGDGRATLLNSEKLAPKNAVAKGDVDPNASMDVTLFAQTKGSKFQMARDVARTTGGMQAPMTTEQITAKYGAAPESMAAIDKFAKDNGLTQVEHNAASGRTVLRGTTAQMQDAFKVKLTEYEHQSGITFRGRTGTVSVSSDLAPHVKAVLGLDNRPAFKTNYVKGAPIVNGAAAPDAASAVGKVDAGVKAPAAPGDGPTASAPAANDGAKALSVEEIMQAYNADAKLTGKGMTTAFLSLGGTVDDGWQANLTAKGIDPNTVEFRNTSSTAPTSDPAGANGENRLDFYMHKYALPEAKTVMVQAENNDSGMPTGIDRISFPVNGETQITHASVSWGQFEDGWTEQSRQLMEDAGQRAALKGVTITVASGDNGAGDGSPSRKQQVDIPAGLEHFTAMGGTRLVTDGNGGWKSEVGWDGMGASGGGRSMFTARPIWQKLLNLPANLNGSKFDGRAVPDLAANGDPRSGMITPGPQGDEAIGGTSLSAPTGAVQAAKITEATGKPTGYWNPEIYDMAKKAPQAFHDITVGRNTDAGVKGYPAGPGYDLETGNGSIDVGKYIEARNKMLNQGAVAKNLSRAGDFIKENHTPLPIYMTPYQPSLVPPSDDTNK
jgi:kumamolisin